jgi:ribonuclease J
VRVRIHRGAHEIGGNCIEVEAEGQRMVLDLGRPLGVDRDTIVPLPDVAGLAAGGDPALLGVVISHPHQDHYGLLGQVHPGVPVYIGKAAAAVLGAATFFSSAGISLHAAGHLAHRQAFKLGPFQLTPFLNDHSAFDAYSLLVEAAGRRLFYTGDLRGHGRKSGIFEQLLRKPPPADVLLMEGTHVRATGEHTPGPDEGDVEAELLATCKATRGMVAVLSSAQNIDRLVTVYRAARRAGRTLVVDLYGATIAEATGHDTIPRPGFPDLKVYVPNRQRVLVKKSGEFNRVNAIRPHRIFLDEIKQRAQELVVLAPSSVIGELARAGCLDGAVAVWSLWRGYLKDPSGKRLLDQLAAHGVPLLHQHSS